MVKECPGEVRIKEESQVSDLQYDRKQAGVVIVGDDRLWLEE